jgi:hypothetical protein
METPTMGSRLRDSTITLWRVPGQSFFSDGRSDGSYREFEDAGEVASYEEFMSDREAALVEQLEK